MTPAALVFAAHLGTLFAVERVAIVASAGAADGQAALRYADRDAERLAAVLHELGGFDRIEHLREPRAQQLREALARVEEEAAGNPTVQLVFYYSGHADAHGLLLGAERFSFDELRTRLEGSRAAVRVAFIDACYSGSLVRPKGGQRAPGYALDTVEPARVSGAAIISAGTATELAQESGDIEGSYFTHHILSALRGAGDRDGDGVVTLAEAYQYAYSHTLAATLPSVWGPQHPSYEYRLSGTGELPLTRLAMSGQALTFPPGDARVYLVSTTGDEAIAEVTSRPGTRVRLALPAARYHVLARQDRKAWLAEIPLAPAGGDVAVDRAVFHEVAPELAFAKGGRPPPRNEIAVDVALSGLGPGVINGTPELGVGYFRRWSWLTLGPHVSFGQHDGTISNVPFSLKRTTASLFALRRVPVGISDVQLGVALGLAGIQERIDVQPSRFGWAPSASALFALDVPFVRWLAVRMLWSAGVEVLRVDEQRQASLELGASLGAVLRQ
jgi:hypothetical protein